MKRIVWIGMLFVSIVLFPALAHAQTEAVITGVVSDSSGGVLPGVTVTAVHEATGNTFTSITDERGVFRMQARVGTYQIQMELQGFQTVRAQATLLAGQTANIPVQMQPATLQENVTVTAEAPLVNVTQTSPSGNIDPKQFADLPAEGRNWMSLLLVAPGSRTTSVNQNAPIPMRGGGGDQQFFQTNVDGQQVSNELGGGRQPLMSQEMISEVQFISNRFDATQGRSLGVQVNVITKSGTNRYSGALRGNFRDSDIGYAKDPLAGKVTPFKDQQIASSFGGPIVKDKLHFFVYQDYDHNPSTGVWTTPYPKFNISKDGLLTTKQGGIRFDYQLSSQMRFMAKGDLWRNWDDGLTGGSNYPSSAATTRETGNTLNFQL
ncbi:MAG TPA: carboxypeptidase-like regulatory domain-containing protein, partial [Vicinamibacterales bacterium]|nr:carboxypeptidase-like regulatory domain-containing protein [Vicinamibacterales bacterium]